MRTKIDFGKISFSSKRKINRVVVEVALKPDHDVNEFTASAMVYNAKGTDIVAGGQCLDEIYEHRNELKNKDLFVKVYKIWKQYHLNCLHAGTPEQELAIDEWEKKGNEYTYTKACNYLKSIGLYETNFTGRTQSKVYHNEPYTYGSEWVIKEIPKDVEKEIVRIIKENGNENQLD